MRRVSLLPSLLYTAAMLYTGAIIIDKETVFAITTEVHCRSKTTDIHGETNLKPLVSSSTCVYGSLSIGIFEESDSKATKKKLKIGSKQRDPSTAVESPCSVTALTPIPLAKAAWRNLLQQ